MKKNWTMRVALLLVALTLITSCFVSGTFAKYVTAGEGSDEARVAKFGVTITSEGSLFATTYKDAPAEGEFPDITVESSGTDNVVAPGTKNEDGLTFTVTGTPEVAVKVEFAVDEDYEEIFLGDYYPVVFTLKVGDTTTTGTLAEVVEALEDVTAEYPANTNLAEAIGTITLTWEWDFDDNGAGTNDVKDTTLGNLAAGMTAEELEVEVEYNLEVAVAISVSVTQID